MFVGFIVGDEKILQSYIQKVRKTDLYFIMITLWKLYADWIISVRTLTIGDLIGKVFNSSSWKEDEALGLWRGGEDKEERLAHV